MTNPSAPSHVAIILDGNGRWAKARGLARVVGHEFGADRVREVVRAAGRAGVKFLTVYALSMDNKKRPADEVAALYRLLQRFAETERNELVGQGVKVEVVGDIESLPPACQQAINGLCEATAAGQGMLFRLAVAYSAREDVGRAVQKLARQVEAGALPVGAITPEMLREAMWTAGAPDIDLLIRTGGEHRLSDFMLLEASYAELYFTDVAWPDFSADHLLAALADYARRERRFGLTSAQVQAGGVLRQALAR
ncbi:MAG: polyprenyl diphosphate synthase [Polyangiaceae bacterium]|jgi:undecaprenyl diphosphate synthase|nr:polyprenyl diphosphate synthase [Polyangiaceae bacterium]